MICVSYTRLISGCIEKINSYPGAGVEKKQSSVTPIAEQNEKISQFAKKNRWVISKKYSDRKSDSEDETVFLQMAEDGIARKFDMLVIWSMFFFGRNISSARDLLRDVFYPAGLHFAVAEDDFCSIGKTEEEVMEYLESCLSRYRKGMHSQLCASYSESCKYKYFGYIWQPDGTLIINEETAPTIRKVFELVRQGIIIKDIAEYLNTSGIETPMQYRARVSGRSNAFENGLWKKSTVRSLISKRFYTGIWVRKIGGEDIVLTCPEIIPETEYQDALNILESRSNTAKAKHERCKAYFSKFVYDADTGERLMANNKLTKGVEVYCPKTFMKSIVIDEGKNIKADKVFRAVLSSLSDERSAAEAAQIYIHSIQGKSNCEIAKSIVRAEMQEIMYRMGDIVDEISNHEINHCLQHLEQKMTALEKEMEKLDLLFSDENPWIKLFSNFDKGIKFSESYLRQYLNRIEIKDFSDVNVFLNLQEWKILPASGGSYVQNKQKAAVYG